MSIIESEKLDDLYSYYLRRAGNEITPADLFPPLLFVSILYYQYFG